MKPRVIGYVDRSWKPPRKSKLEMQIEREDALYWAQKEEEPFEYEERPHKFVLTAAAKHVFARSIEYASLCYPWKA